LKHNVTVNVEGKAIEVKVDSGKNILQFLNENSFIVESPCGGNGKCGKCKVKTEGMLEAANENERKLLGDELINQGYRLACSNQISSDIHIYLQKEEKKAKIMTSGKQRNIELTPIVTKELVKLEEPTLEDQTSDLERVISKSKGAYFESNLDFIRQIPNVLRSNDFLTTLVYFQNTLISVEPGDTRANNYSIGVDIGTTTIAAYLLDMTTGKRIDVYSILNPQRKYGADVLSRIDFASQSEENLNEIHKVIVDCINIAVQSLCMNNKIMHSDIYVISFVGNTTMMHLLMKLPSRNIAVAPFIPTSTIMHKFKASDVGIKINEFGYAVIFPSISGYIGADTVGAILSSGLYTEEKPTLLIDLGTNGEIVLGTGQKMYACSTAAGPAFEGANIHHGVGGIPGAIDKVQIGDTLQYTTIDNNKAIGLCGSGLIDVIAGLISIGIIDETGRIVDTEEIEGPISEEIKSRIIEKDGKYIFLVVEAEKTNTGEDIIITQKDVRELQNAKAAVAAGIRILVKNAGIEMKDVNKIYLAGGFGSFIKIESAVKIGLLPNSLAGRIESIGNAAGMGAVEGLLSKSMLDMTEKIKNKMNYIELSSRKDFVDEYIECMMFE
jgi:uncharacterized 2Fe-2S/4Fe-4S cluster protein (DUF4445 family)